METGGSSSGSRSFSKHTALTRGNFNMLELFFLPSNNKRELIPGEWRESGRRQNSLWIVCSHPRWKEKLKETLFCCTWHNGRPDEEELDSATIIFRVELLGWIQS